MRKKAKVTDTRVADDLNVVKTVVGGQGSHLSAPCPQCPWRKENAGSFPAEAFRISANTSEDMSTHTFGCHMSGVDHPATCAGFLLSESADDNLAVRIGRLKERYGPIRGETDDLFSTYRQMAEANGVAHDDPALDGCMPEARNELPASRKMRK